MMTQKPLPIIAYIEALTEIEPQLPPHERDSLRQYQESPEFDGDSRWPGWVKYLGVRPESRRLKLLELKRRSA